MPVPAPLRRPILALLLAALPLPAPAQAPPVGSAPLGIAEALDLFRAVCADNAPGFAGAPKALRKIGTAQNPETGTYFHPGYDLSFSLVPRGGSARCSMVFASDEAPSSLGFALATGVAAPGAEASIGVDPATGATTAPGPGGTVMEFLPLGAQNGATFFRATLTAP